MSALQYFANGIAHSWGYHKDVYFGGLKTLDGLLSFRKPIAGFTTQSRLDLVLYIRCGSRHLGSEIGSEEGKDCGRVLRDSDRYGLQVSLECNM